MIPTGSGMENPKKGPKMERPELKENERERIVGHEKTVFEDEEYIVSFACKKLRIFSKREQRSMLADLDDWWDYGLHVFTPESAEKAVEIMFDYDKILKKPGDEFSPTMFKVVHKESGFFSCKANKHLDPKKNRDGEWDPTSEGWDKIAGGVWVGQSHALQHIKNMFRFTLRPEGFETGEKYYAEREKIVSKYEILAIDNEGHTSTYEAEEILPKTENHRNWSDFKKWDDLRKEEERLAKQKLRDRKKQLEDLKKRS